MSDRIVSASPFSRRPLYLQVRDALAAQGVSVSLHTVSGGSHGNFKDPKVAELIREFLEGRLKAR